MSRKVKASRKQRNPIPLLLAIGGGILLIITGILVAINNAPAEATPTAAPTVQASGSNSEITRVSVEDAKAALDAGSAVFVDVRGADVYAMSHIPGALSIPLGELESRLAELNPDQWVITYCT